MDEEKRKMKKEILILMLVLCIFSLSFIAGAVVSQTDNNEAFVNSSLHEGISYINSNSQYLDFIARSKYKSVNLVIEDKSYYFAYENNAVNIKESLNKPDLTIKMSYKELEEVVNAYNNNHNELMKLALNKIPFGVKFNLFFQCIGTDWCRKKII